MGLLPGSKYEERIGGKRIKRKETSRHILNRKADRKLDHVADLYSGAIGDRLVERQSDIFDKTLHCQGFRYLTYLNLNYTYENRFWAFSYNLNHQTTLDMSENPNETNYCRFIVKNKGKMGITDAQWLDGGSQCSESRGDRYLELLNQRLIIDRIVDLDMTKVEVVYQPITLEWSIRCTTLIGSTTWVLIPPVMQLITPKTVECIKMLEFFELVADAVSNRKMEGNE